MFISQWAHKCTWNPKYLHNQSLLLNGLHGGAVGSAVGSEGSAVEWQPGLVLCAVCIFSL